MLVASFGHLHGVCGFLPKHPIRKLRQLFKELTPLKIQAVNPTNQSMGLVFGDETPAGDYGKPLMPK